MKTELNNMVRAYAEYLNAVGDAVFYHNQDYR
jgi:hypothetical protein